MTSPTIFSGSKVYACYTVYNEEELIRSSLNTVAPHVDGIFALSGKWFGHEESNDRTNPILEEYNAKIIPYKAGLTQVAARNYLYGQVPEGDWIFIIDGDEIVAGNMKDAISMVKTGQRDICSVLVFNNGGMWTLRPRFVRSRKDFYLGERHWDYNFGDNKFFDGSFHHDHDYVRQISIMNCNFLRSNPPRIEYWQKIRNFLATKAFYEEKLARRLPA